MIAGIFFRFLTVIPKLLFLITNINFLLPDFYYHVRGIPSDRRNHGGR
jgi:hypothetical protein